MKVYVSDLKPGDKFDAYELIEREHLSVRDSTRMRAQRELFEVICVTVGPVNANREPNVAVLTMQVDLFLNSEWLVEVEGKW